MLNGLTIPTILVGNDLAVTGTYGFRIRANTELRLAKVADSDGAITILTLGTHYTVNGINDPSSANWTYTLVTALASGYKVYAYPMLSLNQPDQFSAQEGNFAETIEAAFDRVVVRQGQQQYELDRSLKVEVGADAVTPAELSEQLSTAVSNASASASAASTSAGTASTAASTATTKAGEADASADAAAASLASIGTAIQNAVGQGLAFSAGDIHWRPNVQSIVKSDTFSGTSTSWAAITGFEKTISVVSASNRVNVDIVLSASSSGGSEQTGFRLTRNGTVIAVGDAGGNRTQCTATLRDGMTVADEYSPKQIPIRFVDTPGANGNVVYAVQYRMLDAGTFYLNRGSVDNDVAPASRTISTIILTELPS